MNKLKNSLQLAGILLSYYWIISLIVKSVDGLAYETFFTIVSWIAVFQISTASEFIKGLIESEPEDKPETAKAIPWIKSIPDQTVTINQVHAGNFWDYYPWANFVTEDSDGDIYIWQTKPEEGDIFDCPQWLVAFEDFDTTYICVKRAPKNYREPNWQDHIARRGEMPQWLKKHLP